MTKISYRPVFDRKKKRGSCGKVLLQVEAYLSGKRAYFSTHIYLAPDQWNEKKSIIVRHPDAESLNYMLQAFIMDLEHKEMELWKRGEKISLEGLKRELKPMSSSFLEFVKQDIDTSCMKESTQKNQRTTLKLLESFRPKLKFREVDFRLVVEFESFMKGKGLGVNTVAKHLKHLRTFVNRAIAKGRMKEEEYPFRRYRIKAGESKHSFLTQEELKKLEELVLPESRSSLRHTLDAFLFCCYTGLRYSDFVHLTEKNIERTEGQTWIVFSSVKTGTKVRLPAHLLFGGKACGLLDKYEGKWGAFFSLRSNNCVNHELHTIGKLAGIGKHFTFHSARHTNATLLVFHGANITTVQKLLGHRSVTTTQIYSEITGKTIVRDLIKCDM